MSYYCGQQEYPPPYHECNTQRANYRPYESHPKPIFSPNYCISGGYQYIQYVPGQYVPAHAYEQALQQEGSWAQKLEQEQLELQLQQELQNHRKRQESIQVLLQDLGKQIDDIKREREIQSQLEECSYQAYIHEQESLDQQAYLHNQKLARQLEAQKKRYEEKLAATKEETYPPGTFLNPLFEMGINIFNTMELVEDAPVLNKDQPIVSQELPSYFQENAQIAQVFLAGSLETQDSGSQEQDKESSKPKKLVQANQEQGNQDQQYAQQKKQWEEEFDRQIVVKKAELKLQMAGQKAPERKVPSFMHFGQGESPKSTKCEIPSWRTPMIRESVNEELVKPLFASFSDILLSQTPIIEQLQPYEELKPVLIQEHKAKSDIADYEIVKMIPCESSPGKGDCFDQQEMVVLLFEELPSFVDQEKEDEIPVTSVQQGVQDQGTNQSLEEGFDDIIADFCEKLAVKGLELVPIQGCSILDDIISKDFVQESKLEQIAPDSQWINIFDELLADLTKDDDPLTIEEELTWLSIMTDSHEKSAENKETSKESPKFTFSRGCPIRHLSRMEFLPEFSVIDEQIQHIYSPQKCIDFDQIQEVCDLVYYAHDMLQEFQILQVILYIFSVACMHASHPLLVRKGSYFNQSVNGCI